MKESRVSFGELAYQAHRAGNLDEAASLYLAALNAKPDDHDALHLLGVLRDAQGQHAEAAALIEAALARQETAAFRCNLAMVLGHLGRHQEATDAARRALALRQPYPEALNNLGVSLKALGQNQEAISAYEGAVASRPSYAEAWTNLGHARRAAGQLEAAVAAYEQALALQPGCCADAPALLSLAIVLACLDRFEEAQEAARRAVALDPGLARAHAELGEILRRCDRHEEAEAALRRAAALAPGDARSYASLALVLDEQDRPDEALALLDLGIGLAPTDPEARHHRAMLLLRQGRFAQGWAEYDWRFRIGQAAGTFRDTSRRAIWRGEPLDGRAILLEPEQGIGDTIQFCRYATLVAARGGRVLLGAPLALASLLRVSFPDIEVIAEGEAVPEHALHCPLLSLPHAIGTLLESVPAAIPYLAAPPEAASRWELRLPPTAELRAGLVWAGNPNHPNDRRRSPGFAELEPLWRLGGIRWHSLQVGPRAADLRGAPDGRVDDLAPELGDFAETATAIGRLDVVVTPDTAVAHLAGALGKPVLVMLSFASDWRWIRGQDSSPWYPTMRLFRRERGSGWRPVMEQVAAALQSMQTALAR